MRFGVSEWQCCNDKGGKVDEQAGRKEGRKKRIKREKPLSFFPEGPHSYEDQRLLSGQIDIVASEKCPTRYKKEREKKRKHLESGIITRLIIYADHYFDGADRPPSITFVPPLVLPAILFSFKRSRFAAAIPLLILSPPHTTRPRSFIILKLFVSVTAKTDIINSLPLERITVKRAPLG